MSELTVGFITDLHFGPHAHFGGKLRKLTGEAPRLTRAFVERMNREVKPDLVVNLGDDIEDESLEADRARYEACQSILRGCGAPLVNVAGNHDTVNLLESDLLSSWGLGPASARLYRSFDHDGVHFIVLHTRERKERDVSIGEEQLAWLRADLAANPGTTVVLMHHSAADQDLRGNRWFEGRPHLCLVRERRQIRAVLEQHGGVHAVFNGHLHWNHLDVISGIPYVTIQSLIENLDEDAPGRAAEAHAVARISARRVVIEVEGRERARYQIHR